MFYYYYYSNYNKKKKKHDDLNKTSKKIKCIHKDLEGLRNDLKDILKKLINGTECNVT